jgi:ribonuclease HII
LTHAPGFERPAFAIECLSLEDAIHQSGYASIAGVDEVGRGCWAGPVYAAAVVLAPVCYADRQLLAEVTDSKLHTPSKRERLAENVLALAAGAALGWVEPALIDQLNILGATRLAMSRALQCLAGPRRLFGQSWGAERLTDQPVLPAYALMDAVPLPEVALPQRAVIRGDQQCLSIAAASIVAKVARDAEMQRRAAAFPEFDLERNKGYGTRRHARALLQVGLSPQHRRSFAPMKYLLGVNDCVVGYLPRPGTAA